MAPTIGVVRETAPGERRVALVPAVVAGLVAAGREVLVQTGAGVDASFPDSAYAEAGATVVPAAELYGRAGTVVCVSPPRGAPLRTGQTVVGLLAPREHPELVRAWATGGITAISLDLLPRKVSRAQAMDALTSQATVAGYKAALVAANAYGGFFPMLTTAAGTVKPATVLVLGAGVAGLQALGTARRLCAVVTGYDVRPETREEITSVGARVLDLPAAVRASGEGGYARALTTGERQAQQQALDDAVGRFDVVITTAAVPGGRPPLLVTAEALKGMRPGSVVVDTARGPRGGNVALSEEDTAVTTDGGVVVIGAGRLPSAMPAAASTAYARNILATLRYLDQDEPADEVRAAITLCRDGTLSRPHLLGAP